MTELKMEPIQCSIAVASGKGGTGKTFLSTNLAVILAQQGYNVHYLDCDVEAPNGHLFLHPENPEELPVSLLSPARVDPEKCTACGLCVEACHFNALALIKEKVLLFQNLCHLCGACTIVCPEDAIVEEDRKIGTLNEAHHGSIQMTYGILKTGEGGMTPRLIKTVKSRQGEGISILDSPPGTACPAVETVRDADLCILVTDPTPFGLHDLKLAVEMCREIGKEPVVVVNRAGYKKEEALYDYCRDAELEILGTIPDDRRIAECYSGGSLAVETIPEYRSLFKSLADTVLDRVRHPQPVAGHRTREAEKQETSIDVKQPDPPAARAPKTRELVIISGKGGTGKTSLAACFSALSDGLAIADCDVDAADLHLILNPVVRESGPFIGGQLAGIDADRCTGCGACAEHCRFDAIGVSSVDGREVYQVDALSCEGCGVCGLVCPDKAVQLQPAANGRWMLSDTRFGPMSHAALGTAQENSGKLVTQVRLNKDRLARTAGIGEALIDGSPGTGCPVIASLTGADYAVIVTEPTVSGIHDLKRAADLIRFLRIPAGVIVNKSDLNREKSDEIETLTKRQEMDFLGMIPYDCAFTEAQIRGLSLVEYTDGDISERVKTLWRGIIERTGSRPAAAMHT